MANLTFHLGTRRLVVGLPRIILLMLPVLMKQSCMGWMFMVRPRLAEVQCSRQAHVTVVTKLRDATAVFSGLDRGGHARWADHRTSS